MLYELEVAGPPTTIALGEEGVGRVGGVVLSRLRVFCRFGGTRFALWDERWKTRPRQNITVSLVTFVHVDISLSLSLSLSLIIVMLQNIAGTC